MSTLEVELWQLFATALGLAGGIMTWLSLTLRGFKKDIRKDLATQHSDTKEYVNARLIDMKRHVDTQLFDVKEYVNARLIDMKRHVDTQLFDVKGHVDTRLIDMKRHVDTQLFDMKGHVDTQLFDMKGHVDTRFDAVDRRIDDLEKNMDTRFEHVDKENSEARTERKELGDKINNLTQSLTRLDTSLTYTTNSVNDKLVTLEEEMRTFTAAQRRTSHDVGRLEGYLEMHRRKRRRPLELPESQPEEEDLIPIP